jgi:peptidoglycan/LPS O-acetylase OafA/YrhL
MTSGTDDAYDSAGSRLPAALRDGLARSRLPGLDGLRMISVFSVVFYHCGLAWSPGSQGVLAFFVLSGFLITWLLLKEEDQFGNISLTLFLGLMDRLCAYF